MNRMITVQDTMLHVQHILNIPKDTGYVPLGPYPGMSEGPNIRPEATRHAFFHEASHMYDLQGKFPEPDYRGIGEILADISSYAIMSVLGMQDNPRQVANYRHVWGEYSLGRLWMAHDAWRTAEISAMIANRAMEVLRVQV